MVHVGSVRQLVNIQCKESIEIVNCMAVLSRHWGEFPYSTTRTSQWISSPCYVHHNGSIHHAMCTITVDEFTMVSSAQGIHHDNYITVHGSVHMIYIRDQRAMPCIPQLISLPWYIYTYISPWISSMCYVYHSESVHHARNITVDTSTMLSSSQWISSPCYVHHSESVHHIYDTLDQCTTLCM